MLDVGQNVDLILLALTSSSEAMMYGELLGLLSCEFRCCKNNSLYYLEKE